MSTFFQATTRTQITGLTASTWNRNINVGSFVAVPAGATHVAIQIYHNSGTGVQYGVQAAGTTPDVLYGNNNRFTRTEFIPLGGSNLLDFFTGNITSCRFFIVGYTNHITNVSPIDVSSQVTAVNTPTTVTVSGLPDDAANGVALVLVNSLQASVHAVGDTTIQRWRHLDNQLEFVPLDSLKRFVADSASIPPASSIVVVGWMPQGAVVWSSDRSPRSVTTINTWELQTWTDTNPISIFKTFTIGNSTTQLAGIEAGGFSDAGAQSQAQANKSNPWLRTPDGSGQFSVRAGSTNVQFHHWASIVANLASVSISGIDQLIAGQTTVIDFTDDFTATTVTISDGTYSFVVSSGITQVTVSRISFTCPSPQDETVGAKVGNVTVTASNGSDTTPEFSDVYSVANHAAVELLSVDDESYAAGRTPALEVGSQVLYPNARCTVSDSGVFETEETGTTILVYDRSPSDGQWRFVYVETGATPTGSTTFTPISLGFGLGIGI